MGQSYTTWLSILLNCEEASGAVLGIPTSSRGSGINTIQKTFPEVVFATATLFWREQDFNSAFIARWCQLVLLLSREWAQALLSLLV